MREHLLGYMLGALDADEQELVEQRLEADPELRRLLSQLEGRLGALDALKETHEPPADLASRTCDWITSQLPAGSESRPHFAGVDSHRADAPHAQYKVSLPTPIDPPIGRRISLADFLVAASILLAAGVLLLPALATSRQHAQRLQCENNLRQLGVSLASYSDHSGGRFPYVPTSGNRAAAGIYGPMLLEDGYLTDPNLLLCSSSSLARQRDGWRVPTLREVEEATGDVLLKLHKRMGGSYAYTLGYMENGKHVAPRNQGRSHFVLMSDAPCSTVKVSQSPNHGRCGQNVLFEDLSVRFIVGCMLSQIGDDIFHDRDGNISCGKDPDDSCVADSHVPPLR